MLTQLNPKRWLFVARAALAASMALGLAWAVPAPALAASITVNTLDDELNSDGDCSLREAIQAANTNTQVDACPAGTANDRIALPAGEIHMAHTGIADDTNQQGDWDLLANMSITGAGRATQLTGSGDRVFDVAPGATVTLGYLTIQWGAAPTGGNIRNAGNLTLESVVVREGRATPACFSTPCTPVGGQGGGIYNTGTLSLFRSTVTGNGVTSCCTGAPPGPLTGGGLYNSGKLGLHQSSIYENTISDPNNLATNTSGAGVYNGNSGTLDITRSVFYRNQAPKCCGGAIRNDGTLTLSNSTISDNYIDQGRGGGLANYGNARLTNVTFFNNTADFGGGCSPNCSGGGLSNDGTLSLGNSLIAGNVNGAGTTQDCGGSQPVISRGYNLIGNTSGCTLTGATASDKYNVNPLLSPLANNGGPTLTNALNPGSPAIDAANPAPPGSGGDACPATDQRGTTRPRDGNNDGTARCDIGAYER